MQQVIKLLAHQLKIDAHGLLLLLEPMPLPASVQPIHAPPINQPMDFAETF
jgi:hypothetical protein